MQDLRYALRALRKQPGFTFVAVFTLALGIGASTAIFSLLNAVVLRSLPYSDPDRLAYLYTPNRNLAMVPQNAIGPASADFYDWQRELQSFSRLAIFDQMSLNLSVVAAQPVPRQPIGQPAGPATGQTTEQTTGQATGRATGQATGQGSAGNAAPGNAGTAGGDAGARAQRIEAVRASADFFATLGVQAAFGRVIGDADDRPGGEQVAVISHALWQSAFGGDAAVLGRSVALDGRPHQVIGVMPPAFRYPRSSDLDLGERNGTATDVWLPLALTPAQRADRSLNEHTAIGRLRSGVTFAQAQAELTTVMARLDALHSADLRGWYAYVLPARDAAVGDARSLLWLLLGAVSLVLLIACSNAAHLLLARAAGRAHEMGVRTALGARRARLIAQALAEALLLAGGGGLLGVVLASGAIRGLLWLDPGNIPRLQETSVDAPVLIFCVGLSLLTGLLFGLFPALAISRVEVGDLLRRGGQHRTTIASTRLRRALIVVQMGVAVVLLAGAGLLLRSYDRLQRVDLGFAPAGDASSRISAEMPGGPSGGTARGIPGNASGEASREASTATARIALDGRYARREQRIDLYRRLLDALSAAPGVTRAGAVDRLPLSHSERVQLFDVEGYPFTPGQLLHMRTATTGYFDAMGTPLLDGRVFTEADRADRPGVLIVNQAFVKAYLGGRSAIGRRVRFPPLGVADIRPTAASANDVPWRTIVGVVADVRHSNLEDAPPPQAYEPLAQADANQLFVVVRSTLSVAEVTDRLRASLGALDPTLAIADVRAMDTLVSSAAAPRRFQMMLLGLFAGVALCLAAIGLYGLMAYTTKQRTSEIGIRLALGADRRDVVRLVLGQGALLALLGLTLGVGAALSLTRLLRGWLYDIAPTDPLTFAAAAVLLGAVALVACLIPAGRAARVEPAVVLRGDG